MADSSTVTAGNDILAAQYNNLRKDIITNALSYVALGGSANAFTASVDSQFTAYAAGNSFLCKANFTVTGSATANFNSIGAKTIKKPNGDTLNAGDIVNGQMFWLEYDGTDLIMTTPKRHGDRIGSFTTDVTLTASTTETTLFTLTVPGNALGSTGCVSGKIYLSSVGVNNGASLTLRLKYGGTTIATASATSNGTTSMAGEITFDVINASATNSQEGSIFMKASASDIYNGGSVGLAKGFIMASGTAAVDSTSDQTLAVTAQFSSSSGNNTITAAYGFLELIA